MKKSTKIFIVAVVIIAIALILANSSKKVTDQTKQNQEVSPYLNSNIEVKTFKGDKGWGYDISIDGTLYVHQPNIPALPGDSGFETEEDAKAVAELMVQKIRQNILPPGVTAEEVNVIIKN